MIDGVLIFIGGMVFGAPFWIALAWHRFCRTERPKIVIELSRKDIATLNENTVMHWLGMRGLTWMPRGKDFQPKVKP